MAYLKKSLLGISAILGIFSCFCVSSSKGASISPKSEEIHSLDSVTVSQPTNLKVGYFDLPNFYMLSTDGAVSEAGTDVDVIGGYGYSLLNGISSYNNWTYTFVSGTWQEQLDSLKNGTIDLLLPTAYTEERASSFYFAKEVNIYNILSAIYTSSSRTDLYYNDPDSIKKINSFGLIEGNFVNDGFLNYASSNSIDTTGKIKYYGDTDELRTALLNGDVEAMVAGRIAYSKDIQMISEISADPSYIAAKSQDLAAKIDNALLSLNAEKTDFMTGIYSTYYGRYRSKKAYTYDESQYVKSMKDKSLNIVGNSAFEPFESYDEGQGTYVGAYSDVVSLVAKEAGLSIAYKKTDSLADSWNLIKEGGADLLSGVYVDGAVTRGYNVLSTSSFYSYQSFLIMKQNSSYSPSSRMKVAIQKGFVGTKNYLDSFYPEWEISYYSSATDGVNLLINGEVDGALISSVVLSKERLLSGHTDLYVYPSFSVSIPLCIGVYSGISEAAIVQGLISKVIDNLPTDSITECFVNNTVGSGTPLTPQEIFLSNLPLYVSLIAAGVVLFAALAAFLGFYITERNSRKKLTAKNEELQRALQLAESYEKSRDEVDKTLDSAQCGIMQISVPLSSNAKEKMHLVFANEYASTITGFELEKNVSFGDFSKTFDSEFSKGILALVIKAKGQGVGNSVESSFPAYSGGKTLDALARVIAIFPKTDEKIVQITLFDVSERSAVEKELLVLSETDQLTGLLNKKTAEEREAAYLSTFSGKPCALLLMDIDKFKNINDINGHPVGDEVLISFSSFLKRLFPADSIIGRIGGDEFSVLLLDASDKAVLKKFATSIVSFGKTYMPSFTCSLGAKIFNEAEEDFEECYKRADGLLYFSKRLGMGHFTIR